MRLRLFSRHILMCLALCLSLGVQAQDELKGATLKVYVDPTCPPVCFIATNITKPVGIDVDIIKELQARLGFSLYQDRIFPLGRIDSINLIKNNEADIIGGALSNTRERRRIMQFSPTYFETGLTILYSKEHSPECNSLANLAKKTIVVAKGSTAESFVKNVLTESKAIPINDITVGYFMVAQGKADCLIYDKPPLAFFARKLPSLNLAVADVLFNQSDSRYGFAFPLDSPYADVIYKEMEKMIEDGTMHEILVKWQ